MGAGSSGQLRAEMGSGASPKQAHVACAGPTVQTVGRGYRVKPACHAKGLLMRHLGRAHCEVAPLGQAGAVAAPALS